jgi:hypothetical protein
MTRPFILIRILGTPLIAACVFTVCAAVLFGWHQGQFTWLAALFAVAIGFRTWLSVRQVRRYKSWAREWNAMGATDEAASSPAPRHSLGAAAMLVLVLVPLYIGIAQHTPGGLPRLSGLSLAWFGALLYLCIKVIRRITARGASRRKVAKTAAPVTWLVGAPSFSPSRLAATRALPEYSARLLSASTSK